MKLCFLSYFPGIDVYDWNGNKLANKYINVLSSMPNDEIFDKNGKKLDGEFMEK